MAATWRSRNTCFFAAARPCVFGRACDVAAPVFFLFGVACAVEISAGAVASHTPATATEAQPGRGFRTAQTLWNPGPQGK